MVTEVLRKIVQVLMIFSIILTIGVIFYNSTVPPKQSIQQSNSFKDQVAQVVPPKDDTNTGTGGNSTGGSTSGGSGGGSSNKDESFDFGAFIQKNIRNIAHFVEYAFLAVEIAVYILIFNEKKKTASIFSVFGAFLIACTDEFIQKFFGRTPDVEDVMLDVAGFAMGMLLSYLVAYILVLLRKIASYVSGVKNT